DVTLLKSRGPMVLRDGPPPSKSSRTASGKRGATPPIPMIKTKPAPPSAGLVVFPPRPLHPDIFHRISRRAILARHRWRATMRRFLASGLLALFAFTAAAQAADDGLLVFAA